MKKLIILVALVFPVIVSAHDSNPIVVEELTKTTKSWDGTVLPPYKDGQPEITILKITVQPNTELPWHSHPIINAGYMVKGKLTVITQSGDKQELVAGDTIVELTEKIHKGFNDGTEPVEVIVFYAGVVETPLTVKAE